MSLFYFPPLSAHLPWRARTSEELLLALVSDLPNELHNITRNCRLYAACERLAEKSSYRRVAFAANTRQILARLGRVAERTNEIRTRSAPRNLFSTCASY